jgi:hypothetical protein
MRAGGLYLFNLNLTKSANLKISQSYGILKKEKERHPPFAATFGVSYPP